MAGPFESWQAACNESTGYDQPAILEHLIGATEEVVRSGGHLFERDSVVFSEPITPFPLLAFLLLASGRRGGRLTVLDFGGSLGSTYRQCQPFLAHLSFLRWNVVEQAHVAATGGERFTTDALRFYDSIEKAIADGAPDVVILSGVLQYLDDPYAILTRLIACKPLLVVIDRNPFSERNSDVFSLQIVSDAIFSARLPFRIFGRNSLENALAPTYRKRAELDTVDPEMRVGSVTVHFSGKVFEYSKLATQVIDGLRTN